MLDPLDEPMHAVLDTSGTLLLATRAFRRWAQSAQLTEIGAVVRATARGVRHESPKDFALQLTPISGCEGDGYLVIVRPRRVSSLSRRQLEVAELAAVGATVREIGAALGISTNTVRQHLKAVYAELGVANRVELARAV
ncbi:helix-turn-helix transcriptional regulator [Sandaracinus amylolyticus]|uniref:helix-turn-helix transcriptional regulator n=1 Tax=Sandaracinus amylolyticus TaxID=927083 RepID=UPI001F1FD23E|nr:helix-turn-helix transcriptional regulator [Sandaracinus amylolyticus]UJR84178.1 Hypothetical protein I5071_62490 [Sandaracinus amylolyticus]